MAVNTRRESMRAMSLGPARSIEETGLDPSLLGGFPSPHTPSPGKDPNDVELLAILKGNQHDGKSRHSSHVSGEDDKISTQSTTATSEEHGCRVPKERLNVQKEASLDERSCNVCRSVDAGWVGDHSSVERKANPDETAESKEEVLHSQDDNPSREAKGVLLIEKERQLCRSRNQRLERKVKSREDFDDDTSFAESENVQSIERDGKFHLGVKDKPSEVQLIGADANTYVHEGEVISVNGCENKHDASTKIQDNDLYINHLDTYNGSISNEKESGNSAYGKGQVSKTFESGTNKDLVDTTNINTDMESNSTAFLVDGTFVHTDNFGSKNTEVSVSQEDASTNSSMNSVSRENALNNVSRQDASSASNLMQRRMEARSRWRRAANSVKFINHMVANIQPPTTFEEVWQQQRLTRDDAGAVGAAAFEGATTAAQTRFKGRKGMDGLLVRQDRGLITFFQDFYVACLKMPIGNFLVGVFLAPVALGFLFTPLYLLDVDGLSFNGIVAEDATTSPLASARERCLAFLNVFLYALSLSTTFGGAPVAAESPFCLLIANMNTLMAQFLFVFLSGAVFARMSQPSYPIRCAKKAIIKTDDLIPILGLGQDEKYRTFSVRIVLTGPSPCEMVDIKVCLTFRIFVTLPSGYVFCSTQDLEVVRSQVSYLRYGLMVRHIIDQKSPVYQHTMETLRQGDASFSLTVMGLERTSMQPVFHIEDYFVCDDDVVWEGDYEDFIHINQEGQRVLDHSRIDKLKPMKSGAVHEGSKNTRQEKADQPIEVNISKRDEDRYHSLWRFSMRKRKVLNAKSTSFTRADR